MPDSKTKIETNNPIIDSLVRGLDGKACAMYPCTGTMRKRQVTNTTYVITCDRCGYFYRAMGADDEKA